MIIRGANTQGGISDPVGASSMDASRRGGPPNSPPHQPCHTPNNVAESDTMCVFFIAAVRARTPVQCQWPNRSTIPAAAMLPTTTQTTGTMTDNSYDPLPKLAKSCPEVRIRTTFLRWGRRWLRQGRRQRKPRPPWRGTGGNTMPQKVHPTIRPRRCHRGIRTRAGRTVGW